MFKLEKHFYNHLKMFLYVDRIVMVSLGLSKKKLQFQIREKALPEKCLLPTQMF